MRSVELHPYAVVGGLYHLAWILACMQSTSLLDFSFGDDYSYLLATAQLILSSSPDLINTLWPLYPWH